MAQPKPTIIEISVCPTGKIDDASLTDSIPNIKSACSSSESSCLEKAEKCCVCIKMNDSDGHHTNFIPLPTSCGTFQKHFLEQRLSIVSLKANELEFEKLNNKSLINVLVANIPAFGILCALISVLCFSFNSVIVKLLKSNYGIPGIQVLVIR